MIQLFFLVGVLLSQVLAAASQSAYIKGIAKSKNDGQLVYIEKHNIEIDEKGLNKKINTKYLNPSGKLIAQGESNFLKNPLIPDVVFEDFRFGIKETLTLADDRTIVIRQFKNNKSLVSKSFALKDSMAAGQGFDNFIKTKFEELKHKDIKLNFGVISQLNFFTFKAYTKKQNTDQTVLFGIELINPLYRLFSDELILKYDIKNKKLLTYQGLSNLLNEQQNTQAVIIEYEDLPMIDY